MRLTDAEHAAWRQRTTALLYGRGSGTMNQLMTKLEERINEAIDAYGSAQRRITALETALRTIAQAASDGADAMAIHNETTSVRLAAMGRFEALADAARMAVERHD